MEDELGGKLFERTTRSVVTTEFGSMMIEKMRGILVARLNLLNSAADFLNRDENTVRIDLSPLISDDFSKAMLDRAEQAGLKIVLTEMNKSDIAPAIHSGTIDFGLCPAPLNDPDLRSMTIYSEPLLFVSDQQTAPQQPALQLAAAVGRKFLLVPDDCGLADTVRLLFVDQNLDLDEYEGRALGYHILEKWARMGIGVTLLPASQVFDARYARSLKTADGHVAMIVFQALWAVDQEARKGFLKVMACLGGAGSAKPARLVDSGRAADDGLPIACRSV